MNIKDIKPGMRVVWNEDGGEYEVSSVRQPSGPVYLKGIRGGVKSDDLAPTKKASK